MNKCMTHEKCIPPEGNPKGNLRSVYYHSPTDGDKNPAEVRVLGFKICDCCGKIIKISQVDLE